MLKVFVDPVAESVLQRRDDHLNGCKLKKLYFQNKKYVHTVFPRMPVDCYTKQPDLYVSHIYLCLA